MHGHGSEATDSRERFRGCLLGLAASSGFFLVVMDLTGWAPLTWLESAREQGSPPAVRPDKR